MKLRGRSPLQPQTIPSNSSNGVVKISSPLKKNARIKLRKALKFQKSSHGVYFEI
jgi:hypothetical protein